VQAFDPSAALRQPDVAQPSSEQPALTAGVGRHTERPEPPVDCRGVHPDPVVAATQLVSPLQQGRSAQAPHRAPPLADEVGIGLAEAEHDPSRRTAAEGDRRVRVGHELRDDLDEIDAALSEVLPEVAAVHAAVADQGRVDELGHCVADCSPGVGRPGTVPNVKLAS